MTMRQTTLTRRQRGRVQSFTQRGLVALKTKWGRVMSAAARSLRMSPADAATAIAILDDVPPQNDAQLRLAAMVHARALDMLERNKQTRYGDTTIAAERAALVESYGPAFLIEVQETGESPDVAAVRIRYIWVNLARALRAVDNATRCIWTSGGWWRRCIAGCARLLSFGRRFERSSSHEQASPHTSLSGSISELSTRTSSSGSANLSLRCEGRAEGSSARPTPRRRQLTCASSTASRGNGPRPSWSALLLGVQNTAFAVRVLGGAR